MRYYKQKKGAKILEAASIGVRTGIGGGMRTIKMLQPICMECQPLYRHPLWWKLCTHKGDEGLDYLFETRQETKEVPILGKKEVNGVERDVIIATEQVVVERRQPNLQQVPTHERINSGKSMGNALYHGCVRPEDLGYRKMCEYGNCFEQPDQLLDTPYGFFCTDQQARLVAADVDEITLEIADDKKRKAQLQSINLDY